MGYILSLLDTLAVLGGSQYNGEVCAKEYSLYKLKHCLSLCYVYGKYGTQKSGLEMKYITQLHLVLYLSLAHSFPYHFFHIALMAML